MAYEYTNLKGMRYYLNSKELQLKNGQNTRLYFFSKDMRPISACDLPNDKVVKETAHGLPVLKKKI